MRVVSVNSDDEASIFAGELVGIYKRYADTEGWKVSTMSEQGGEQGGVKTSILQITGTCTHTRTLFFFLSVCLFLCLSV